ncbi:uncharacterized protein LOC113298050 [Papaver somniferum]|uniref:uncharacterized protein LOC113298050 n=1 Tax=Papaver somniferum TaxID=3469 RepID=UPI000E6FC6CD|nr:uncharacterized protein LOC113298050 [Papaver somniferum]
MVTEEESEKRIQSIMDNIFRTPKPKSITSVSGKETSKRKRGDSTNESSESSNSTGGVLSVGRFKRPAILCGSSLSSEAPLCRPWDRSDLLRRLATFKSMTWFGKPKAVSAINCALRGWINVEMDIIACEACGSRLLFSTPSSWSRQQIEKAAAVFSLKLDSGHKLLCPWIDNACEERLAQFPPTTPPALADSYKERSSALLQLSALPKVSSSAIDYMRSLQLEGFLEETSTLEIGPGEASAVTYFGSVDGRLDSNLYYQALKLIALCGWEIRTLPYAVDCDVPTQSSANIRPEESSLQVLNQKRNSVIMSSTTGGDETDIDEERQSLSELQSDPASSVLDCRLCGASVGLWAFSTIRRPLEMFRLIGSSEVNGRKDPGNYSLIGNTSGVGGPREEAHVASNGIMSAVASLKEKPLSLNLSIAGGPSPAKQNYRATVSLPVVSRHFRSVSSKSDVRDRTSCALDNTNSIQEKDHTYNTPCVQIAQTDVRSDKRKTTEFGSNVQSRLNSEFNEVDPLRNEINSDTQERDCLGIGSDSSLLVCEAGNNVTSSVDANADSAGKKDSKIVNEGPNVQKSLEMQITTPSAHCSGKEVEEAQLDHAVEFDPIKQHRHFCPWIISTGNVAPGWQQTLKALDHEKDPSHLTITSSPPSTPMLELDDPITSIRKLFTSPSSTKRKKVT